MYEVELKIPAELDPVRRRLLERGANELGSVRQVDTYYDHPTRSFAATDEALRVRRETDENGSVSRLTYKGPLVESASMTRREVETTVADGDVVKSILRALEFEPVAAVRKTRERYEIDEFVVSLDTVSDLGTFVEIDCAVPEEEIETCRQEAQELLSELGLDPAEHCQTSYLELLLESGGE